MAVRVFEVRRKQRNFQPEQVRKPVHSVNLVVAKVNATVDKLNSGQGTIGQLVVNPQLYESMNGATRELQGLIKDMHANPKKFLRIKLALF